MGVLSWIVLGLIAGALAKWIMPGDQGGGWLMTMVLGIVGALLGGWIGAMIGFGSVTGVDLGSILTAVVGALVALFVYETMLRKKA